MRESPDLVERTLDSLILRTIAVAPKHGWAIAKRIQQASIEAAGFRHRSLYPALHRLEQQGWIEAQWAEAEMGRRAKFYSLTPAGHTWMQKEVGNWNRPQDLFQESRVPSRTPAVTAVAAFSLALGVGASATGDLALAAVPQTAGKVRVCLNQGNDVSTFILARAEAIASRIFVGAAVALEWHSTASAACRGLQQTKTVALDFTRSAPDGEHRGAMAYAWPYEGIHIVVMYDRIEANADGPMQVSSVLGHVMAHEITHVVQGIARHSQTGVMKAHWDAQDFCRMMSRPLQFTPDDIDLIQTGLSRRALSRASPLPLPAASAFH